MKEQDNASHLLIVEDDSQICSGLKLFLEGEGFHVEEAYDGEAGLRQAVSLPGFDLVILDARLPGMDGFDLLQEMRAQGVATPVLILTGLGSHEDKIRFFNQGADDYLTKPFSTDELLARIHAILRRVQDTPSGSEGRYLVGGLVVDLDAETVTRDGESLALTDKEFKLLRYLILHRERTASNEQILRAVWQLPGNITTRTIDQCVNSLRRIMECPDEDTGAIKRVYKIGYKMVDVERID